jgi:2-dehydro-3-deoxyphosphogluconate aldolase/(4S)-4-hydroxy-2-oxoglutarate aldolase
MKILSEMFNQFSLVPVVVLDDANDATPLAEALLNGGIKSIEITLRTDAGLKAIEQVAKNLPDILVGSGTILNKAQMQAAHDAGAQFHVSPGITDELADYASTHNIAWLAGVANSSNIMQAHQHGLTHIKFFPAALAGGVPMLKQFISVFPNMRICPTGGIDLSNLHEYMALKSVFAVGGSWLTPKDLIAQKNWAEITKIAKESTAKLK